MPTKYKYSALYAESGGCSGCSKEITDGVLRLSKIIRAETYDGTQDQWYHVHCFFKACEPKSVNDIHNLYSLRWKDVEIIRNQMLLSNDPSENFSQDCSLDVMKRQSERIWEMRDKLKELTEENVEKLLNSNEQYVPSGAPDQLDALVDAMVFGCIDNCPECGGLMSYCSYNYKCTQIFTGGECLCETKQVQRTEFKIPTDYSGDDLVGYRSDPSVRLLPPEPSDQVVLIKWYLSSDLICKDVKVKGEVAVDPNSGPVDESHIYIQGCDPMHAILAKVHLDNGKNSFYKLQLLESNSGGQWWVFRSWGRIGTNIGNSIIESFEVLQDAMDTFYKVYTNTTGNEWANKHTFEKIQGKYYQIGLDYVEDFFVKSIETLETPVQELIKFIFTSLREKMIGFEIDVEMMPLKILTKEVLETSCRVLGVLRDMLEGKTPSTDLINVSNQFYTLVPHNTGTEDPPLIDSLDVINQKLRMIDTLKDIELDYRIICILGSDFTVDNCYKLLDSTIEVLDRTSDEFQNIKICVEKTGKESLKIKEVFKICRNGEEERFEPFKSCPNRLMLWHGSRAANWVGILHHGLRIKPEGAIATGEMLSPGVYFADSVSSAEGYSELESSGKNRLILLCEVALGNMVLKRQPGRDRGSKMDANSSVFIRNIARDPNGIEICGVRCPCGTLVLNTENSIKYEMDGEVYSGDEISLGVMESEDCNVYNVYTEERVRQRFLVWLVDEE